MIYRVTKVSESTRSSSRGSKKCITVAISPRTNEIPLRNILCGAETRTPIKIVRFFSLVKFFLVPKKKILVRKIVELEKYFFGLLRWDPTVFMT